jgi:hypothetical protein
MGNKGEGLHENVSGKDTTTTCFCIHSLIYFPGDFFKHKG